MNWFVIVVGFRWAASCDGYYENIVDCYFGVLLFSVQNFFDLSCVQAMAFLAGFMTQSLKTTFGIYGVGVVMLSLVSWRSVHLLCSLDMNAHMVHTDYTASLADVQ
jgi:hypothetical protein